MSGRTARSYDPSRLSRTRKTPYAIKWLGPVVDGKRLEPFSVRRSRALRVWRHRGRIVPSILLTPQEYAAEVRRG
jgi:hypothetical protein